MVGVVDSIQVIFRNRSGFLEPRRRLLPVEFAQVLDRGGQQHFPSGSRARGPLVQHPLLFFSSERPEVPGQVVQDRPCEVSVGPPGAYRVGVVAECDAGLARACVVRRGSLSGPLSAPPAYDSTSLLVNSRRACSPARRLGPSTELPEYRRSLGVTMVAARSRARERPPDS